MRDVEDQARAARRLVAWTVVVDVVARLQLVGAIALGLRRHDGAIDSCSDFRNCLDVSGFLAASYVGWNLLAVAIGVTAIACTRRWAVAGSVAVLAVARPAAALVAAVDAHQAWGWTLLPAACSLVEVLLARRAWLRATEGALTSVTTG